MKIIRFSNNAIANSDVMCLKLAKQIVQELKEDKNLDIGFSYSNQVFLNCLRSEIFKTDEKLFNKIKWMVEDKICENLDTLWDLLPNIEDDALETILTYR